MATEASEAFQRSIPKTSGQFNNELADVTAEDLVTSVDAFSMATGHSTFEVVSRDDLYDMLKKEGDALLEPGASLNSDSPFDLGLDLDSSVGVSDDFLENFTDLSTLFFNEDQAMDVTQTTESVLDDDVFSVADLLSPSSTTEVPMVTPTVVTATPEVTTTTVTTVVKQKLKRKVEASSSSANTPSTSDGLIDHGGYASRPKRTRLSSTMTTSSTVTSLSDLMSDSDSDSDNAVEAKEAKAVVKYKERRRKNNIASRRSRETRKQKFANMEGRAIELETANAELRERVTALEELAKEMKEMLIKRLAQTK